MSRPVDITGQRFGRLVALRRSGGPKWLMQCDCGNQKEVAKNNLASGDIQSCGCLYAEWKNKKRVSHDTKAGSYSSYHAMKQRCLYTGHKDYPTYGGRGIRVCDRWLSGEGTLTGYQAFLADMGERPVAHTLDRINPDADYSPSNCRWATLARQNRNRRDSLRHDGEPLADIAERLGIPLQTLGDRYRRGDRGERLRRPVEFHPHWHSVVHKGRDRT